MSIRIESHSGPVELSFDMRETSTAIDWVTKGDLSGTRDVLRVVESGELLIAGVDGVTNPELVSKIDPVYPRQDKLEKAQVILQAIIEIDGSVRDIQLVRINNPGKGFEKAAIDAVRRWRYKPATKDGEPVAVYFHVVVDFSPR